jgi:hypothetical protein
MSAFDGVEQLLERCHVVCTGLRLPNGRRNGIYNSFALPAIRLPISPKTQLDSRNLGYNFSNR